MPRLRLGRGSEKLAGLMSAIDCRGGHTQIGKVLSHARQEYGKQRVQALVFVGDAMEEKIDDLCKAAGELGLLGVPVFMFQEGDDPVAENAYREIARLSRGAYCRFDTGAAHQLGELLRAVAAYAAGGIKALADLSARRSDGARKLLAQLKYMPTIIFGLLVLVLALWALSIISKVDPKIAARVLKASGGILAIGFAVFLGLRGEIGIAIPLGIFGLGLLGWMPFGAAGFSQRTQKSAGQTSHVRSAYLEMELDHDSGAMRGRIVAGRHQGAALERSTSRRWPRCWTRSTRKAARYWWRILTAGIPAGVNTRKETRQRGGLLRPAAK